MIHRLSSPSASLLSFIRTSQIFGLGLAIGLWLVISAQGQTVYRVTDLGNLPGGQNHSIAWDINDHGQVVGSSYTVTGARAFQWTSSGGMQNLGDLPSGRDGSDAFGINNAGHIVGSSELGLGNRRPFLWTTGSGIQDLAVLPGAGYSQAFDINDQGQVVGASGPRAVLWTSDGGMQELGDLPGGGTNSGASAINDGGQVVGSSDAGTGRHAYLWTSDAGMQDLGDLPGGEDSSSATDINNGTQIVGSSEAATGGRAFLWTSDAGMQDLGDLPGGPDSGSALGINDSGQVVGVSSGRAFVWTSDTGMQDLNGLIEIRSTGWILTFASAINNAGQIVGNGTTPYGATHAYLLTPVTESPVFAHCEFNEPPLGAGTYRPGATHEELGFTTATSPSGGSNPLAGVDELSDPNRARVLSHRSLNALTEFDVVDLANYNDVTVSLMMQVGSTRESYRGGDGIAVYVTNGTSQLDLFNAIGVSGEFDELDTLAGDGFFRIWASIPNSWTSARLVIGTSTDSPLGDERFDFDSIEFRGVAVIPEPGTWGVGLAALVVAVIARRLRIGTNRGGRGGARRKDSKDTVRR